MPIPPVEVLTTDWCDDGRRRLLIVAEGFEHRGEALLNALPDRPIFDAVLIVRYKPPRPSRTQELLLALTPRSKSKPRDISFDRFRPAEFEPAIASRLAEMLVGCDEVVIDISVMSKLLIMLVITAAAAIPVRVRIVYAEPMDYAPTQTAFEKAKADLIHATTLPLPSTGIHEVVRTPGLSSTVMQRSPTLLIAFTSFNEQLIRALLTWTSPTRLFLINSEPPWLKWRSAACQEIHRTVIGEFIHDNPLDADGRLPLRASTLRYSETFELLAGLYREHCWFFRLTLSPTGSKMQAIASALFRLCCQDVHIEYPTPESHLLSGYSSRQIRAVHVVQLGSVKELVLHLREEYHLNG